jgi:hypothetical protein
MNRLEALGLDPVTTVVAGSAVIALMVIWAIIRVRRGRYRPPVIATVRWNPLPPCDTAIEEIRREIDENQKRSEAARLREAREREAKDRRHRLEQEWQKGGEVLLDKKKS